MAKERPDWLREKGVHFMLVGDGQLMPQVRAILADVASDLVTLTGLVQQDEAPLHLAASDILLSPHVPNPDGTKFFGSPTKLFEYMGMGRAIIASDLDQIGAILCKSWHVGEDGIPAGTEALKESSALLTTPGSEQDLIKALAFLIENPGARTLIGNNARALVLSEYTWESHVQAILSKLQG
jgi:glycosyltransferase involved in cell wall biosynthesis